MVPAMMGFFLSRMDFNDQRISYDVSIYRVYFGVYVLGISPNKFGVTIVPHATIYTRPSSRVNYRKIANNFKER